MNDYCIICGGHNDCTHHLLFGNSIRKLADEDGIYIPMCNGCHNMAVKATDRIHGNSMAEKLSKMLGQALWEKRAIVDKGIGENEARTQFMGRYGRSYL